MKLKLNTRIGLTANCKKTLFCLQKHYGNRSVRNLIYTGLLSADRRLPYISDNEVVQTSINFIKQQQSFSFGNY